MAAIDTLLEPEKCALLLVDFQAGLGFGVESASRQVLLNNAVALARTAVAFNVPRLCSWIQVLLEFQRDWTRHATYEAARAIVVANGGGYGMGLAYAREMIHPG